MTKLDLLQRYTELLAHHEGIWFEAKYITEGLLQQHLRKICWLIEDATGGELIDEIEKLDAVIKDL